MVIEHERAPKNTIQIQEPYVIVVEGKEDKIFLEAFIKHLRLQKIQVIDIGGKTKFRDRLTSLRKASRFSEIVSLGVIRDANSNPDSAFQSICDALRGANLPVPERPLVPSKGTPQIIVMIVPNENTPGILEDVCLEAVASDPVMSCVEKYFECLRKYVRYDNIFGTKISKAKIHVFLASKPEPDKRLGEAAQAGYWPWDNVAFKQLKNFLQQLACKGEA